MNVTHLYCSACAKTYQPGKLYNLCECGKPLMVAYDLEAAARTLRREWLARREASLWRYRELLPLDDERNKLTLGEGMTPLLRADRLGSQLGLSQLFIKDEGTNPTGSFKARGMAIAVSMAKELGVEKLAVPSAGNAAGALAAYAAKAGIPAFIFMPRDTPRANIIECQQTGAHVTLIDGLITDCGKIVAERKTTEGWFDVSTLKEPYRVEGKKTMGYELAEQLNWELPDVILYPTGGGTGLIGMWKAFDEMEQMGWIDSRRPRMVTVQAEGCAPIVKAFAAGASSGADVPDAHTIAAGLRVPKAVGDFIMLDILRKSGGTAVSVTDDELMAAVKEIGAAEGIFTAPEGAACLPALKQLLDRGDVRPYERVVLFNTGSGVKYVDAFTKMEDVSGDLALAFAVAHPMKKRSSDASDRGPRREQPLVGEKAIRDGLVKEGRRIFEGPRQLIPYTNNEEVDRWLNDIDDHPHCFVLGCILDVQVPVERAWMIPWRIYQTLGTFEVSRLNKLTLSEIEDLFSKPKPLHRFPKPMARYFHAAVKRIARDYCSDASQIWANRPSSAEVMRRFRAFEGVGPKVAAMAANALAREFKIAFSDYQAIDVAPDRHVVRVFGRLGLVRTDSADEAIRRARELNPDFPGLMDMPAFEIGRQWCRAIDPLCGACYMATLCPTALQTRDVHRR